MIMEKSYTDILNTLKEDFHKNWTKNHPSKHSDSIQNYEVIRTLGAGSFGRVIFVKCKKTHRYLAAKMWEKEKIVKLSQVEHTLNEKKILECCNYPFIVNMISHFKDNVYLFMVLEFVPGGDMFYYLRKKNRFSESHVRFYASQIILALEYLHSLDIGYRDLKPENILMGTDGYLKLADFGFAKVIKGRTYTVCGTPEYLAPEIIRNQGYNKAVDWWACGVLIYEFYSGFTPFYSENTIKMYEKIVAGKFRFPSFFGHNIRDLCTCLIQNDLTKRFGNLKNGIRDIKEHKWFTDSKFNWLDLYNKKLEPPIIPTYKEGDTSHFEEMQEENLKESSINKFEKQFADF